ncbi:outer membrane beta-barrel family protein [Asticcacaulis sp. EMRT-3]|uniref:outer membrane beta-barrel family protein n=1 Tax=Asticcacaulis sp. EMRT-3 TaxID=3040349 RepID=UPI0024AF7308|nr:outer membrane beta-barrel family protein [Asticcacaulis sp. EMRT-3]MDI7776523.1 outer membrane beta-barrel family protein [Asticcacaulis sp. EMRT-3]
MKQLAIVSALAAPLLFTHMAMAQGKSSPKSDATVKVAATGAVTVTVVAKRPIIINKVDRKVYRTDADVMSASASAADILNHLPSVEVDADGNVSLRGDTSVSVLIDGKPLAEMQGSARAAALQSLSASQIQQVEVMTSPSAAFRPDGLGGVINIVTRKSEQHASSGAAIVNIGDAGRYNADLSMRITHKALALHGSFDVRNDVRQRRNVTRTVASGSASGTTQSRTEQTENGNRKSGTIGLNYTPTDKQDFGASLNYATRDERRRTEQQSNSVGANPSAFSRDGYGGGPRTDSGASLSYDRKTDRPGEELSLLVQTSQSVEKNVYNYRTFYASPSTPSSVEQDFHRESYGVSEFSLDYIRPLASGGTLKLGTDSEYDQNRFDDTVARGIVPDVRLKQAHAFDNSFRYRQTINAAYLTYDNAFGKFEVLAGLRAETVHFRTLQIVTGDISAQSYATIYPTLNAIYALTDQDSLTLGYSKRVRRRDPEDLNPYINASDPNNLHQGNPLLKPETTDSLEAGFRHSARAGQSYELTAYYRKSRNGDTEVLSVINPDVALIREVNLPHSRSGGLEFIASGKFTPALGYNLSGNAFYSEVNALALGAGARSTIGMNAKFSLDYQATAKDRVQVSTAYRGKRLTAQGYVFPYATLDVGYRHEISKKLALVATVSDLFNSQKQKRVFDTPTYVGTYERRQSGRLAYVGLSYTFGGDKTPSGDFSYEQ